MLSCASAGWGTCLRPSHLREVMHWRLQPTVQREKLRREAAESQSVQASRESEACSFSTSPAAWDTQHLDGRISSLPVTTEGAGGSWARGGGLPQPTQVRQAGPKCWAFWGPKSSGCSHLGAPSPHTPPWGESEPRPCPGDKDRPLASACPTQRVGQPCFPASSGPLFPASAF